MCGVLGSCMTCVGLWFPVWPVWGCGFPPGLGGAVGSHPGSRNLYSEKESGCLQRTSTTRQATAGASLLMNTPLKLCLIFCWLFLGLQPYTNYSFTLTAFTSAGCTSSEPSVGQTLQAAPQGNQDGSVVQRKRLYVLFRLTV